MHSVCTASYGYVDARIDEQTCVPRKAVDGVGFAHNRRRQRSQLNQFASAQVLFPKLNRIYFRRSCQSNAIEQQTHAFIVIG